LPRSGTRLSVKLEQHHIAVLDDIFLAFIAGLAGFLGRDFAAKRDEIVIGDGLGADEAALEIGMDDAGRLRGLVALVDGPGTAFLGTDSEIGLQAQKIVSFADQAIKARLVQAEAFEIFGLFGIGELSPRHRHRWPWHSRRPWRSWHCRLRPSLHRHCRHRARAWR